MTILLRTIIDCFVPIVIFVSSSPFYRAPWRTSVLWSVVAFALFVATTSLLFRDWSSTKDLNYWHPNMTRLDLVLSAAAVSLVTALIYLIDILITVRFGLTGDLE